MKKSLSLVSAALAATLTLAGAVSCGSNNNAGSNDAFRIGVSGPLTGGAAIYGTAVQHSVELAVNEINAAGGLDGVKFEFKMLDDEHKADKIAANYAELKKWGMQLSLGTVTSTPCLEFKNYAQMDGLFFLTPSATNDGVPDGYDGAYQMCFKDSKQGNLSADYIKQNCADKKVGVLYNSEDTYSKELFDNFKSEFDDYNFVTTSFLDSTTDFASQIETLKDCDFIYMPTYYTPAATFMLQANGKMSDGTIYFGCDGFDGIDTYLGDNLNAFPQEISMLSHFNSASEDEAVVHYVEAYTAAYGKYDLNQFGASAYDCVYALFNALKKAKADGKNVTPSLSAKEISDIFKEVFTSADFAFNGITGKNVTWEANGEVNKHPTKYVVKAASK